MSIGACDFDNDVVPVRTSQSSASFLRWDSITGSEIEGVERRVFDDDLQDYIFVGAVGYVIISSPADDMFLMVADDWIGQLSQIAFCVGGLNLHANVTIWFYVGIQRELFSAELYRFGGDRVFYTVGIFQRDKAIDAPLRNPELVLPFSTGRIAVVVMVGSTVIHPHLIRRRPDCFSSGNFQRRVGRMDHSAIPRTGGAAW